MDAIPLRPQPGVDAVARIRPGLGTKLRMSPLPVVEDLDVFAYFTPRLCPRFITSMMHQFVFERAPKTFHRRIVIAVSFSTHRTVHVELLQQASIVLGAVLTASVTVMNQPRRGTFRRDGVQ